MNSATSSLGKISELTQGGLDANAPAHKNIAEAFLAIMEEVGYVRKTGKNAMQKYTYAGEGDLIRALRPALMRHGVIFYPSQATSRTETVVTDDGKKTFRTVIDYVFTYTHVESKTNIDVTVVGEGVDTGDKSAYKAATGALKYALRQPFLIETGDEPEKEDDKPKLVFTTAVKRKEWAGGVESFLRNAGSLEDLKLVWTDHYPVLEQVRESPSEDEAMYYEHLVQVKDQVKKQLQEAADKHGAFE